MPSNFRVNNPKPTTSPAEILQPAKRPPTFTPQTTSTAPQITDAAPQTKAGEVRNRSSITAFQLNQNYNQQLQSASRASIQLFAGQQQNAKPPKTFTQATPNIPPGTVAKNPADPKATGAEAAAGLLNINGNWIDGREELRAKAFAQALEAHSNDSQWTQDFLRALGTNEVAQIMRTAAQNPGYEVTDNVITALRGLQSSGRLERADMNNLVKSLSVLDDGRGAIPRVDMPLEVASEIFAKAGDDTTGLSLKNSFAIAAFERGMQMEAEAGKADSSLQPSLIYNSDRMAMAASHVLASAPPDYQADALKRFNSVGLLDDLVRKAMVERLGGAEFSRVPELFNDVANFDPNKENRWGVTSAQLSSLRATMFNAAAQELTLPPVENGAVYPPDRSVFGEYNSSTLFKDALSTIYQKDFASIMRGGLPSEANDNPNSFNPLFIDGLKKFYEFALFTKPPANNSMSTINFTAQHMNAGINAINQGGAAFTNFFAAWYHKGGQGLNSEQAARLMGQILGTLDSAIQQADRANVDDKKTLNLALDFVLGALSTRGGAIGAGVVAAVSSVVKEVAGELKETMSPNELKDKLSKYAGHFDIGLLIREIASSSANKLASDKQNEVQAFLGGYNGEANRNLQAED